MDDIVIKMRRPLSEVKSEPVRKDFPPIRGKLGGKYGVVFSIDVVVTETEHDHIFIVFIFIFIFYFLFHSCFDYLFEPYENWCLRSPYVAKKTPTQGQVSNS